MAKKKQRREWWRQPRVVQPLLFCGLLAVAILALFAPSLKSQFAYDSIAQVRDGDFIHYRENLLPPLTFQVMRLDIIDFNRPVALLSLMFDSVLWGRDPFGYHLTNILLHIIGTGLVFVLARHVLARGEPNADPRRHDLAAFCAAGLFAVHPVLTEAVCEPSNRRDMLAMIFGFTALLLAARHDAASGRGDLLRLFLIGVLSLLSVGSKEVGAAFPAILAVYWGVFRRGEPRRFWAWAFAACAVPVTAFVIVRFALEHDVSQVILTRPHYPADTLGSGLLIQSRIYLLYVVNVLWPTQLCADYESYSVRFLPAALAVPVLLLLGSGLIVWGLRDRRVFFAFGVMVAGILPASNVFPQFHPAADRYLYIPLVGAAILVAMALDRLRLFRRPDRRWMALAACVLVAAALSRLTLQREAVWASPLALWEDTMARDPRSPAAWESLPEVLADAGRRQEARWWYERAFQTPVRDDPWLWAGYAVLLDDLGDHAQALVIAHHALALKPDLADADKMMVTLQNDRPLVEHFARLVASEQAPAAKPSSPAVPRTGG